MAIGILGLCLTVLGIILAYIWKGNHKMDRAILAGQERMEKAILDAQERMEKGILDAQERMEKAIMASQERLEEGQKEIAQILQGHTQMLLAQTRILERIEGKIPAPSVG